MCYKKTFLWLNGNSALQNILAKERKMTLFGCSNQMGTLKLEILKLTSKPDLLDFPPNFYIRHKSYFCRSYPF